MGTKKDKKAKDPNMGMSKHGKSGHSVNADHFTGKKGGKTKRRKGRRNLTRKQRQARKGSHKSKFKKT